MIKTLPLLLIISLILGCGGYKFQEIIEPLEIGKPEDAYTYLQKHAPKKQDIPYQFELGLVAHYANRFPESNEALDVAGDIAEDRYTKSVLKEVGSLATSDKLRPYTGTRYERLLSHYYRALNYVYLNQLDGALVECRRATNLINYFKGEEGYDFFGAAFLAHLSGMLFEARGEWNDALISYKQAAEYYQNAAEMTGVPLPDDVGHSLIRLVRKLGFTEDLAHYKKQYNEAPAPPKGYGELILFYESGYVPRKDEVALMFPILKTDKVEDAEEFVPTLVKREGAVYEEVKLEYLLRIAMPTIRSNRPRFAGIRVAVGENQKMGVLVEDVENIAIETFDAQRPVILFRTLLRAVGKYLLYREANKQHKALGVLANLAGVVTEQADTRSWQTLPNQIFMVRMPLPAGTHTLNLSFLNAKGGVGLRETVQNVEIYRNQITFLNYRTYE